MFELYLSHGRTDPAESMDEMGFNGPRLQGVIGLHQTYSDIVRVVFRDVAAKVIAQGLTGWSEWDANQLSMQKHEDMIEITTAEGEKQYFGDWGLWSPEHAGGRTY
ncbi:hypothetical protein [Bradyrhizobium sp. LTSP885]|uniref:hypothetical protein n=1 Tax=Bradyrhizobium sp. LTSP885 TaxID=1619232 RepID=UPI0005CA2BA7|nr:hypothetical protein [Bradyrhizobium sp. LTSP885]